MKQEITQETATVAAAESDVTTGSPIFYLNGRRKQRADQFVALAQ
jgi:hypothetical protein